MCGILVSSTKALSQVNMEIEHGRSAIIIDLGYKILFIIFLLIKHINIMQKICIFQLFYFNPLKTKCLSENYWNVTYT